jgi:hypothetical protein
MPVSQESLELAYKLQRGWIKCVKDIGIEPGEYSITDEGLVVKSEKPSDPEGGQS